MNSGKMVFSQIMDFLPWWRFHSIVKQYRGNHKIKRFSCAEHFRVMAFAQLTHRKSLRDVEAAIKLHTKINLRGNIPEFIHIPDGKLNDVNALDLIKPELGAFYLFDRAYTDFQRLYLFEQAEASFVSLLKKSILLEAKIFSRNR